MKEASGELNLTVVVVIVVAMLAFFFFSILWPQIRNNFASNTKCNEAICGVDVNGNKVQPKNGMIECYYRDKNNQAHTITCAWKG
ncbi:MAG: hypothetical protein NC483_01185 [Ruminococcus sp.]|nr:hypothetical protein [Ruminococcus sp.]